MNQKAFFDAVRTNLFAGTLQQVHVDGITAILAAWDKYGDGDGRKLAYILATVKWETAHTMQPIAEYGKGRGKKYGKPDPKTGNAYYGRGFVQITWKTNYQKAGRQLGLDLVNQPELALQPGPAARIIVSGMMDAWFTNYRLADFINDDLSVPDFRNARKIVNGMDKASEIAAIAFLFLEAINLADAEESQPGGSSPASAPPSNEPLPSPAGSTGLGMLLAFVFDAILIQIKKWRQS